MTGDRGMATSGVITVVVIAVLALLFLAIVPLLSGTEQSGRTQTSADAAALAGAGDIRANTLAGLPTVIRATGGVGLGSLLGPARGHGAAQAYAGRNAADLVEYTYDAGEDEVYARTGLRQVAPNGDHAESQATASLGVELGRCAFASHSIVIGFEPVPTPTPTPTPTVSPTPEPTPTPTPTPTPDPIPIYDDEYRFSCTGFDTGWRSDVDDVLTEATGWLETALEPRLAR